MKKPEVAGRMAQKVRAQIKVSTNVQPASVSAPP